MFCLSFGLRTIDLVTLVKIHLISIKTTTLFVFTNVDDNFTNLYNFLTNLRQNIVFRNCCKQYEYLETDIS